MAGTPNSTPIRGPPLIPSTSPFVPQRRVFGHRRNDSFADNLVRSGSGSSQGSVTEGSSRPQSKRLSDGHLASRKAEEAASRRFQAAGWVKSMIGNLDMTSEPSEEEFRLCLRNGLILCSIINKVQPGAVPKVVENYASSLPPEGQPLSAYQYFENVRNFLVAVEDMKLPTFEASDLEQGSLQAGSTTKIVDCILALKSYYEWKQCGGNGFWKYAGPLRSPMVNRSTGNFHQRSSPYAYARALDTLSNSAASINTKNCRQLDLSSYEKPVVNEMEKIEQCNSVADVHQADADQTLNGIFESKDSTGVLRKQFGAEITNIKENIDQNLPGGALQTAILNGSTQSLVNLIFATLAYKHQDKVPLIENSQGQDNHLSKFSEQRNDHGLVVQGQCLKSSHVYQFLLEAQRKEVTDIRGLLRETREDVKDLQTEYQKQLELLESQVRGLSGAAAGYYRVLKENKNLYNSLQDLKGSIRVYCRIRPFPPGQAQGQSTVDFIGEDGSLIIVNPLNPRKDAQKMFNFNKVFRPSATQEEVFVDTQPLIRSVMDGYNVCIFAYGQTGSGKTYTMSGPAGASDKDLGVNYRALDDLFQISQKRKDLMKYEVWVQMIEIYNEQVRDLLATDVLNKKLDIRNNSQNNGFNVPDASLLPVKSTSDVLDLMNFGQRNRAVSSTALNDRSSRSHSVLTVHVQGTDHVSGGTIHSCLHLVDLAGSERVDKSEVIGDRLKEAQYINKSLSSLGDVIAALAQKNSHVPYRNSKLTQLLQDSLGGQAKTLMFVHISPEFDSYGETISTLKFAERVATVELGAARLNKESGEVRDLREQVDSLKKALSRKEAELAQLQSLKESPLVIDKHKTKTNNTPVRSQRLSLDGPGCGSTEKLKEESRKVEVRNSSNFGEIPEDDNSRHWVESGETAKVNSVEVPISKPIGIRRSSVGYGSDRQYILNGQNLRLGQANKAKTERMICSQPPKTPERRNLPKLRTSVEIEANMAIDGGLLSNSSETERLQGRSLNLIMTPSKKASQIRKSLQTIGKFIHGSEKRTSNQAESLSPFFSNDRRLSAGGQNQYLTRRQSLTGLNSSGSDRSRRASIGGKFSFESRLTPSPHEGNGEPNSKTPPLKKFSKMSTAPEGNGEPLRKTPPPRLFYKMPTAPHEGHAEPNAKTPSPQQFSKMSK